jgi:hypothetical protein
VAVRRRPNGPPEARGFLLIGHVLNFALFGNTEDSSDIAA